ncbi:phytochrome A1-like [Aristolochia californica]|uniref:phytochrome A1-like n=1 Tax=Aristolochia californica TaxID=171875 RepID=UPI0035DDD84B
MASQEVPSGGATQPLLGMGTDLRSIFTSSSYAELVKVLRAVDVSLMNPVWVHCRTSGKPVYAIIHRVTRSLVIDFEPVRPYDTPTSRAATLLSYKLAAKAISRLQSVPNGHLDKLINTAVREVFELTGYDRVMAYKFHEDEHGEIVSEVTVPDLESYLGLHYPATDIPQAARFLFMKNMVRMICDCRAKPVKVYQDEQLGQDLTLCGSTLRASHRCHLQYMVNMGSIASLVIAVVVNEEEEEEENPDEQQSKRKRLWGLLVCHNTTPRFVPFPLRYACKFLAQVLAVRVRLELELERHRREKDILRTQTLLSDMLLRNAPTSILTHSPNVMDFVKCDGAAMFYQDQIWRLGFTPIGSEIRELAKWLSEHHPDSTGLTTDSLHEAGYLRSPLLGDTVCGMAAVKITSQDMLFWFRSHVATEIVWGGAKHDPSDIDDGRLMNPRSSFNAFLEVVKTRSSPWKDYEIEAIHALQLVLRGSIQGKEKDEMTSVINTTLHDLRVEGMEELQVVTKEMVRLIEMASVPILSVDVNGLMNGWNAKIAELTGLSVDQALGKHMLTLIEKSSIGTVQRMLCWALRGEEEQNVEFLTKAFGSRSDESPLTLMANACAIRDVGGNVVSICFVAQDLSRHKKAKDKFTRIEGDYRSIIQNPNPLIPPLFVADEYGWCTEWSTAMSELTGWERHEVIDKMLLGEIFGTNSAFCRLKNHKAFVALGIVLNNAMIGQETQETSFGFFDRNSHYVDSLLSTSKKVDGEGKVTGAICFLHVTSQKLQEALHIQKLSEQNAEKRSKQLAYLRREIRTPLSGIKSLSNLMERIDSSKEVKEVLRTSVQCQKQLENVLSDFDLDNILKGNLKMKTVGFTLQDVLRTAMSQVVDASKEKGIEIVHDSESEHLNEYLYGDDLRLQQILANLLLVSVSYTPEGGQIEMTHDLVRDKLGKCVLLLDLNLRITHSGMGIPEELLYQMFEDGDKISEEGIGLHVSRKLATLMNGDVHYQKEAAKKPFFAVSVELASSPHFGNAKQNEDPVG